MDFIYKELEQGNDICAVFLDMSKAFDTVYHKGLLHKLKQFGIDGNLLLWFESYLTGRRQRVVIRGKHSSWKNIMAGVPQGSILGPLLFLIYVNDLPDRLLSELFLYADDSSLLKPFNSSNTEEAYNILQDDLHKLEMWSSTWLLNFNATKTVHMVISNKLQRPQHPILTLNDSPIVTVRSHCQLGLIISDDMTWNMHTEKSSSKALQRISILNGLNRLLPRNCLDNIYKAFIRPILEYASVIIDGCSETVTKKLEQVQRKAALAVTGGYACTSNNKLLKELGWDLLETRRKYQKLCLLFKIKHSLTNDYMKSMIPAQPEFHYGLRSPNTFPVIKCRTVKYKRSFMPSTVQLWNTMSTENDLNTPQTLLHFKTNLKRKMFLSTVYCYKNLKGINAIHLTRIRMGLSGLEHQRHRYHMIQESTCDECGNLEDEIHFFVDCPAYTAPRNKMLRNVAALLAPGVHYSVLIPDNRADSLLLTNTLLCGSKELNPEINEELLNHVINYISESKRFI